MISIRWRKVIADLWSNKIRTLLVVLSIAVGVFSVGFVSTSFIILLGDMEADYLSINPHSAFIIVKSTFDQTFINSLESVPGVGELEGRSSFQGRVNTAAGKKATILITSVDEFDKMKIDRVRPNTSDGKGVLKPLKKNEMYLERTAVSALNIKVGDYLPIELEDGRIRQLKVADIVYNIASPPFIFTNMATSYVNPETMEWLGGSRDFNSLYITVAEQTKNEDHVKAVAKEVENKIEKSGRDVLFTFVMRPGRHWATDITQSLGYLMGFLGLLAVFLSTFLVINTISALLSQHIRYIGMMKAIGGKTSQIAMMYFVMVIFFGIIALILALPLSTIAGYATALPIAGMLNFNIGAIRIPIIALILQIAVSLLIPLLSALVPVSKGVSVTVREAISDYGLAKEAFKQNIIDRFVDNINGISRPMIISLRNTFRRKGRLLLTLSTLTLAGAIFMGIFNVRSSINSTIIKTMGYFISDINVSLARTYRIQQLEPLVMSISGVNSMEGWGFSSAEVLSLDKSTAISVMVIAPPANSKLIKPVMTNGRWLVPEDENAIVIGNALVKQRADLKPGDEIIIRINEKNTTWHIIGTYQIAGNLMTPILYANYEALASVTHKPDQFSQLRIVTNPHDESTQLRVIEEIEQLFSKQGIKLEETNSGAELQRQQQVTIDVLILFLLIMAVLIAVVGGLGLTGTMSMNVMERTREIGVMRSTGANDLMILRLVIVEGMLIGLLSWLVGVLLSFPITIILNQVVGSALLNSNLDLIFSIEGFIIWFMIVVIISILASALPARNASRLTIREVLAYE